MRPTAGKVVAGASDEDPAKRRHPEASSAARGHGCVTRQAHHRNQPAWPQFLAA